MILTEIEEIVAPPDDDERLHHIEFNPGDDTAACGYRFKGVFDWSRCDMWDSRNPWKSCKCGAPVCVECVNLLLAFSQLED